MSGYGSGAYGDGDYGGGGAELSTPASTLPTRASLGRISSRAALAHGPATKAGSEANPTTGATLTSLHTRGRFRGVPNTVAGIVRNAASLATASASKTKATIDE
jgi:hypothetical protein